MEKESNPLWKFVGGMLLGMGFAYLYVRFDYSLPSVLQLGSKISSEAVVTTAEIDLYDPKAPPDVRHRALAVVISQKPELFVEIDEAIGNQFFEEILRRKAVRKAKLLKHRLRTYDIALERPALRRHQEKRFGVKDTKSLKHIMFINDIRNDEFLFAYLSRHFPGASGHQLADLVLNVYQNGLKGPNATAAADANPDAQPLH